MQGQRNTSDVLPTSDSLSSSRSSAHVDVEKAEAEPRVEDETAIEPEYPSTKATILIIGCLLTVLLLVALDRLILAVAVPSITDEFESLADVGWYGTAYLLTSCAFMLLLGKIYTFTNVKSVYLGSLLVFEIGSALCGAAPNSTTLIIGRAIAGLGNAGLFQGAIIVVVNIVPMHKRPQYMGFFALVFAVASAVGPVLGGALTDGPGWRWCFYINLPFGGAAFFLIWYLLHIPDNLSKQKTLTWKEKFLLSDPLGTVLFLPSIVSLVLVLHWAGVSWSWSSARVIGLLVLFAVLLVAFIAVQYWQGDNATIPRRVLCHRSVLAGAWFSFFIGSGTQTLFYFVPIWFQAVKGASAVKAGIMTLPIVLGLATTSIMAGIGTKKLGYYTPWMILCSILTPIGVGLVTTFSPNTNHQAWIGYLALVGFGVGLGMQQPSVAAQTVLSRKDVSIGASLMMFTQTLGGAIFVSVGNNVLVTKLTRDLKGIPGIESSSISSTGITTLRDTIPAADLPRVLNLYNDAFRAVFYLTLGLVCCTIFGALAMEWRSVKKDQSRSSEGQGERKK